MGNIDLIVNGTARSLSTTDHDVLLHTLRDRLGLTGAKAICEVGGTTSRYQSVGHNRRLGTRVTR